MELDQDLKNSIDSLKRRINTFLFFAVLLALGAIGTFVFYSICPNRINDWFPANPHDYANNFSVVLATLSGVLFVYIAFLGQRWQMLYQQQEIRNNREEMQKSTVQLEIQGNALSEQIKKMDRDFVHQNFFRILDQHFKTRDRVIYEYDTTKQDKKKGDGEAAFEYFLEKVTLWVDNKYNGWNLIKTDKEKMNFFKENGYNWVDRPSGLNNIKSATEFKFVDSLDVIKKIDKTKIIFILRAITKEEGLGTYLRSCYYLFEYMKENSLSQYLDAVEAGMDKYERIFLFYQMTTRFEGDGRLKLLSWLVENRFLANVKPKHLLHPSHKNLLYPIGIDLGSQKITNPHP